jgi:hypothetical protein
VAVESGLTDVDRLALELSKTPEGVPLILLARALFGDDVDAGDADYQWVRRECERQGHDVSRPTAPVVVEADGELVIRESQPDLAWVFPEFGEHVAPTGTGGHPVLTTASGISVDARESASPAGSQSGSIAKANAETYLSTRRTIETARGWGHLTGCLGGKRVGESSASGGGERTRFNDVDRARRSGARVAGAFDEARGEGFDRGAVVTATTAPGRFDSIADAATGLVSDVKALRTKVRDERSDGCDVCPPSVVVVEPTERGIPHAHVAMFGLDADAVDERELRRYWWETRGRAQQVWIDEIETAGDGDAEGAGWRWSGDEAGDEAGCPPMPYLRAGGDALARTASRSADEVVEIAAALRSASSVPTGAEVEVPVTPDGLVSSSTPASVTPATAAGVRWSAWYFGTGLRAVPSVSPSLRS